VKEMPMPLSREIRERIIYHKKKGATNKEITEWLQVNKRSVERVWKIYKEKNSVEPKEHKRGRKPAFDTEVMDKITAKIKEQPDITLEELVETFDLNISISALCRKLQKLDLTFKKRHSFVKNNFAQTLLGFGESG